MDSVKYIGLDVHLATISIVVLDAAGKIAMNVVIETKASTLVDFLRGLSGTLHLTFEEGTYSTWLYDLLSPHVSRVVVCDPRRNALLKSGNKNDRVDAYRLAELLRLGSLTSVYHGSSSLRTLKELARSYQSLVQDTTRVMNRLKALYRSRGIPCGGQRVYSLRERGCWLERLLERGVQLRAELLYHQLDALLGLRQHARQALLAESRKHRATRLLGQIPGLGPLRAALLLAVVQTPYRFRTKRQLWAYAGLALVTRVSAEYRFVNGQIQKSGKPVAIRGLNLSHNHTLKEIFKAAALTASLRPGPLRDFYFARLSQGTHPQRARLTLARKIASITLTLWKKGGTFNAEQLKSQAA